jgi:hypothetical protein
MSPSWISLRSVGFAQSPELRPSGVKRRDAFSVRPAPRNYQTKPVVMCVLMSASVRALINWQHYKILTTGFVFGKIRLFAKTCLVDISC